MVYKDSLKGSLNLKNVYRVIKYRQEFYLANPGYFKPDGLTIFVGPQGSGKTLSAVKYVINLKKVFPDSIIVTNIDLREFPIDNEKVFYFENALDLKKYSNDKLGVIFLIDEIQLYFNSLASKNIDPEVMVQISQQRKQRKHIVATSQVFGRMAKPLREQFSSVILCKNYFGLLQKNSLLDRDSLDGEESTGTNISGKVVKKFWWLHNPSDYGSYDTYKVIESDFKESGGFDIYGNNSINN